MSKTNMALLGDFIIQCDERNADGILKLDSVRGLSTSKGLIETKANMEGVSLTSYKIVRPHCFAYVPDTSRRGDKVSLGCNMSQESFLVSSISCVFKVKDEQELDPGYLYVYFLRPEFDRYARFNSWGSAREAFSFDDLCRTPIPVPSIEQQRAISQLYECVAESIRLSKELDQEFNGIWSSLIQRFSNE